MDYVKTTLRQDISIKKIVSVHYFEYAKDYVYEGEKHDFWELVYADKGEVEVMADTLGYKLKQGEIIFHKPNEFHNLWANGIVAPNLVVISFECRSEAIKYFENKILHIDDFEKNLLIQIIREAKQVYDSPLNQPGTKMLIKKSHPLFGGEQLIGLYLEQMLIHMIRSGAVLRKDSKISTSVKERSDADMVKKIMDYLEENIAANLSFDDVCRFSSLSRTNLKVLFKGRTGESVMERYNMLKIEAAKKMIREGDYNFTQIADRLGYASIHYFSRHFKKATDMAPSQYASSVKAGFDRSTC